MVALSNPCRFALGRLVATPGAVIAFTDAGESPVPYVRRHVLGDWGDVCPDDAEMNEWALANEARILSAYHLTNGVKVWIITEADRSSTCVLLPSEY